MTPESSVFYRTPVKRYPVAVRGEGVYLWDADGRRYLDGSSGALVANVGHGRAEVAEAMAGQARRLGFAHGSQFTNEALEEVAELLARLAPGGGWRFFAVSGGSEATETAVKLARQVQVERGQPGRYRILSRWTSYHGASLGSLAASGLRGRRRVYEPLMNLGAFPKAPKPDPRLDGRADALELERVLVAEDPETIAAVMVEPVIGASDAALAPAPGYHAELRRICHRHGVLMIADEVMTGVGRCGLNFAIDADGVRPDAIVVGKGLAAGYAPLAGVLASAEVYETVRAGSGRFTHGFTYNGHPVSAAAGAAVLRIVEREGLVEAARERGARLLEGLRGLRERHPAVLEARGRGMLLGLVLGDPATGEPFPEPGLADRVGAAAFERGLVVYPGSGAWDGERGDHLLLGPPLSVSDAEVDEMLGLLDAALEASLPAASR